MYQILGWWALSKIGGQYEHPQNNTCICNERIDSSFEYSFLTEAKDTCITRPSWWLYMPMHQVIDGHHHVIRIKQAMFKRCRQPPYIHFVIGGFVFSRRWYVSCVCSICSCVFSSYMADESCKPDIERKKCNPSDVSLFFWPLSGGVTEPTPVAITYGSLYRHTP